MKVVTEEKAVKEDKAAVQEQKSDYPKPVEKKSAASLVDSLSTVPAPKTVPEMLEAK